MKRIGENCSPSYAVANLASLFTVCACALDGADSFSDEIADRVRQDIKHVLEWGALLATEICAEVEGLEVRGAK